jgi:hypothetical protein
MLGLTDQPTNFVEQNPAWETASCPASEEFLNIL